MASDYCQVCGKDVFREGDPNRLDFYELRHTYVVLKDGRPELVSPETAFPSKFCGAACLTDYVMKQIAPDAKSDA